MTKFSLKKRRRSISVRELFDSNQQAFETTLLCGDPGLDRKVSHAEVHYPGLALTGFLSHYAYEKIQFIAEMEWYYLNSLSALDRRNAVSRILKYPVPAIVVTHRRKPHTELLDCARSLGIPLFTTPVSSAESERRIGEVLESCFAPQISLHASLVDVYGIGLLYTGESGIGKSECVLDLVERGHRLVADDVVTVARRGESLVGSGSKLLGHHMEIRGIGILNIQHLFGIRAIRHTKNIEVIVELVKWDPTAKFERLGLKENLTDMLGAKIQKVTIPIFPGKNITVISEVIAMNKLLKINGIHSAAEFNRNLLSSIKDKGRPARALALTGE